MNGRQFTFGTSGRPLAQFLAMIVMGVVLVTAVLMGAFVLLTLLGVFVIGYVAFTIRTWWRMRRLRGRGPVGSGPEPGPAKGIRYIDGEYEVIEADADAPRRDSGPR
jgi:hypothetical protein